jgi:hypothetical protein
MPARETCNDLANRVRVLEWQQVIDPFDQGDFSVGQEL